MKHCQRFKLYVNMCPAEPVKVQPSWQEALGGKWRPRHPGFNFH